jgi:hypothetical protein
MEPSASDEAGRNATVGKYFQFGGWKLSSTSYDFLSGSGGAKVKNGDQCNGQPGELQWGVAKFNGDVKKPQTVVAKTGNPADYKLYNDDIVVIAYLPKGKSITSIGSPPSLANLPDAANNEGAGPPTTVPTGGPTTTPPVTTVPTPTSKP